MSDERGFTITYNGELYNYRELRLELKAGGEIFRTNSDTEVVLKAYAHWGSECLKRLNGMFAFAVFNLNQREVFLARDPIGIKPLYYAEMSGGLAFSSEIKALLTSGLVAYEADLSMVPFYLIHGYFRREFTPFKQIRQLCPGHWLRLRSGRLTSGCYWSAVGVGAGTRRITPEDEAELIRLIRDAVNRQTVADVPVGVLLSGGLDSGIVTASLARTGNEVRTFTVRFPSHSAFDEGPQARAVAARYETKHHEIEVSVDEACQHWETLLTSHSPTILRSIATSYPNSCALM
jgi:asparagine synthase (glutamine-hydrolysing)